MQASGTCTPCAIILCFQCCCVNRVCCRIHHFDGQGNQEQPWLPCDEICYGQPCWCADIRDRISASLIHAGLPRVGNKMPIYTDTNANAAAGFVLNPSFTSVLCAYPFECVARLRQGSKPRSKGATCTVDRLVPTHAGLLLQRLLLLLRALAAEGQPGALVTRWVSVAFASPDAISLIGRVADQDGAMRTLALNRALTSQTTW